MHPQPGQETVKKTVYRSGPSYDYRYCHTNGQRFQYISRSLKACRDAKNQWIKKQGD